MLKHRIQSGLLLGAAVLAAVFLAPPSVVLWVMVMTCGLALVEFYALLDARQIPHFKVVGVLGGVSLVALTWGARSLGLPHGEEMETALLFAIIAAIFIREITYRDSTRPWETMAGSLLGIFYVAFLFNFFVKILTAWPGLEGRLVALFVVVVVKFTDIGAFFVGCAIGRHKFIPRISPKKTWEGVIGGLVTGVAASLVCQALMQPHWVHLHLDRGDAALVGLLLAVAGVIGDLIESVLKRASGVKDSGTMIQGMGGLLDVLDSLLFAAPVMYIYARVFLEVNH